jgi:hypothetical protein
MEMKGGDEEMTTEEMKQKIKWLEQKVDMAYRSGYVKGLNEYGRDCECCKVDLLTCEARNSMDYSGEYKDMPYTDEMYIADCKQLEQEELEQEELMDEMEEESSTPTG